jgi:hypothetical protein
VSFPRCKRGASRFGGSTPSVRTLGMKLWRQSASLAPRRSGFDSRRLHSSLRSVNGKHTPFVRPRCGFDSCRRLLRGRSSEGRAPERHSEEARSIRVVRSIGPWCKRQHGELQPRRSGFEAWRACCATDRRGPKRLGYLVRAAAHVRRCGSSPRPDRTSRPRRTFCCGPERFRLSTPNRQVAGSSPARSTRAPVAQLGRAVRSVLPRPQQMFLTKPAAGRSGAVIGKSARLRPGGRRVRVTPGASAP